MTRDEIVKLFTLDRVQSKAAQFDMKKFQWMNSEYIQLAPDAEWRKRFQAAFPTITDTAYMDRVIELMKPRVKNWKDVSNAVYFFEDTFPFDEKAVNKRLKKPESGERLKIMHNAYSTTEDFTAENLESMLREKAEANDLNPADLIHPIRVSVSGQPGGPSLFQMLEVIGKERVLQRISAFF